MDPYNPANSLRSSQGQFLFSSVLNLNKVEKASPQREVFDPHKLMTMELIKTPPSIFEPSCKNSNRLFQASHYLFDSRSGIPPPETKFDLQRRMICHEDFPLLVSYQQQLKIVKATMKSSIVLQSNKDDGKIIATRMKQRHGLANCTIFRGQCPRTDQMMQKWHKNIDLMMEKLTITDDYSSAKVMAPTLVLSSENQMDPDFTNACRKNYPKHFDLITWAEDFLHSSDQEKKLPEKKHPVCEETAKIKETQAEIFLEEAAISDSIGNPKKRIRDETTFMSTRGKKNRTETSLRFHASDRERQNNSPRCIFSPIKEKPLKESKSVMPIAPLPSPILAIDNSITVALAPHPFNTSKLPKDNVSQSLEVVAGESSLLSERTCRRQRSKIAFGQNLLSASVATARTLQFKSQNQDNSKADKSKTANLIGGKRCESSIYRPTLVPIKEETGNNKNSSQAPDTHEDSDKENSDESTNVPPRSILSVTFL